MTHLPHPQREYLTIILTGASGFIGKAVQRVAACRMDIRVIPLKLPDAIEFLQTLPAYSAEKYAVIHLAWPTPINRTRDVASNDSDWITFTNQSLQLRLAAVSRTAWFIGAGTGLENCPPEQMAKLGEVYASYMRNKLEIRQILSEGNAHQFSWARLHFMFGPHERPNRFVPMAINAGLTGIPLPCGDTNRRRSWLHVDDVASLLIDFALDPLEGTWDLANPRLLSFKQLLAVIEQAIHKEITLTQNPLRTNDDLLESIPLANPAPILPDESSVDARLLVGLQRYSFWLNQGLSESDHA